MVLEFIKTGRLLEVAHIVRIMLNRIFAVYFNERTSSDESETKIIVNFKEINKFYSASMLTLQFIYTH